MASARAGSQVALLRLVSSCLSCYNLLAKAAWHVLSAIFAHKVTRELRDIAKRDFDCVSAATVALAGTCGACVANDQVPCGG